MHITIKQPKSIIEMDLSLFRNLLSFLVPDEISKNFDLVTISEKSDYFILELEEKSDLVPKELSGHNVKLNGFMNKVELHTFPQKGKACYLHIKRRRWTDKSSNKSYSNSYSFHKPGMKATDELGDFLKKK